MEYHHYSSYLCIPPIADREPLNYLLSTNKIGNRRQSLTWAGGRAEDTDFLWNEKIYLPW